MFDSNARSRAADVAKFIIDQRGAMAQLKLQKLLYYCQAASLAWSDRPMFSDRIEAWANGPVVAPFWNDHRYEGWISSVPEGLPISDGSVKSHIDAVLNFYGSLSPEDLADRSHREPPWKIARAGLAPGQRSSVEMTPEMMHAYYSKAWAAK